MIKSNNKVKEAKTNKNKTFRPFLGISSWWKGRKFYFPQQEDFEDHSTRTENKSSILEQVPPHVSGFTDNSREGWYGTITSLTDWAVPLPQPLLTQHEHPHRYQNTRTESIDSLQNSIESMDSVAESYGDLEDEFSETTAPVVTDMEYDEPDFLMEHLGFLTAHTQPRPVHILFRY